MSSKTTKILIFSVTTSIIVVSILSFLSFEIRRQGIRLEGNIAILKENSAKESSYVRLKRLAQETENKRNLLASSFFTNEGDSIIFLGEIETLASNLGLSLKTESLDKVVDKETNNETIKIVFSYEGRKDVLLDFSKLMEKVPYHSVVDSLSLSKDSNSWKGKLAISITLN